MVRIGRECEDDAAVDRVAAGGCRSVDAAVGTENESSARLAAIGAGREVLTEAIEHMIRPRRARRVVNEREHRTVAEIAAGHGRAVEISLRVHRERHRRVPVGAILLRTEIVDGLWRRRGCCARRLTTERKTNRCENGPNPDTHGKTPDVIYPQRKPA